MAMQHFLLSAQARTLSLKAVFSMGGLLAAGGLVLRQISRKHVVAG